MSPSHPCRRLTLDMLVENLPQLIERKNDHPMPLAILGDAVESELRHHGRVGFPPGHGMGLEGSCYDVVEDTGAVELVCCR